MCVCGGGGGDRRGGGVTVFSLISLLAPRTNTNVYCFLVTSGAGLFLALSFL